MKFTSKHATLMNFLSNVLREDGGFEYKKAIVDTITDIVQTVPEARETGTTLPLPDCVINLAQAWLTSANSLRTASSPTC